MGAMAPDMAFLKGPLQELDQRFGPVESLSQSFPFVYSDYYAQEMGENLLKRFAAFRPVISEGELPLVKQVTNGLESHTASGGKRKVNLDPGILTPEHLVLISGKGAAHRIYLGGGFYGEVTLIFQEGTFRPLPWTYLDYREEWVIRWMNLGRQRLLSQQKESSGRSR
jgi:hypothetical protein